MLHLELNYQNNPDPFQSANELKTWMQDTFKTLVTVNGQIDSNIDSNSEYKVTGKINNKKALKEKRKKNGKKKN